MRQTNRASFPPKPGRIELSVEILGPLLSNSETAACCCLCICRDLSPDDAVAMLGQDEPEEEVKKKKLKKKRVNIFQLVSLFICL